MSPQGSGRKAEPGQDVTSPPVRQANEGCEGTARAARGPPEIPQTCLRVVLPPFRRTLR